jgi:hypothetical protein
MNFLTIQGLIGKLQTHKERLNDIQEDIGVQTLFSIHYSKRSKMVLDIPKEIEDVDKIKEDEEEVDLEEEVEATSIGQLIDRIKQIG